MSMQSTMMNTDVCYVYNLGNAHGHERFSSTAAFAAKMASLTNKGKVIVCFTNGQQAKEREYLAEIGFSHHKYHTGYMMYHTISMEKFEKAIEGPIKEAVEKEREHLKKLRKEYEERYCADGRKLGEIRVGDIVVSGSGYFGNDGFVRDRPDQVSKYLVFALVPGGGFKMGAASWYPTTDKYWGTTRGWTFGPRAMVPTYYADQFPRGIWKDESLNPTADELAKVIK